MRRRRALRLLRGLAAIAAASWSGGNLLAADQIARLAAELGGSRSFKVRVQAAVLLARFRDPRAVEALTRAAASDPMPIVRAVALRQLAKSALADRAPLLTARQALNRALGDAEAMVRRAATSSLAELDRAGRGAGRPQPRGGPPTVAVGAIGDRTGRASAALRERMRLEMRTLLSRQSRIQLIDGTSGVSFLVDGTISRLGLSQGGPDVEAVCAVELVVSRPPRGIVTVASGEAIGQKPRSHYHAVLRDKMEQEAMENAVRSAHENLARFLEGQ
jgi:HEAT repeat protein